MRAKYEGSAHIVNICSNSEESWQSDLSPFKLGPCGLYDGKVAKRHENGWQYAKVYKCHADSHNNPTDAYWRWAEEGWDNPRAVRYPMGRGAVPLYSLWQGERLGYIDARKRIYAPLYIKAVRDTAGFAHLRQMYETMPELAFRDFDGYDHDKLGLSLTEVLNLPRRKMGHAFVLKMLLTNDPALQQLAP